MGAIVHQMHVRGIKIRYLRPYPLAPARKIGQVMQTEVSKGLEAFLRRARIQDDLDQAQKGIVFDDEFEPGRDHREKLVLTEH